ncbi:MAG: hypothetical protein K9G39_03100 [Chlorobium sp.]|uniref:hypothetical protein n=1 Tax=Chlorobium sp. TaxID=1095 RepID=UPI0025C45997|nr:hypothetical protein [Chlorobium sp.]MCF8382572.1 hypothetical protein [Chlorobium sp.]
MRTCRQNHLKPKGYRIYPEASAATDAQALPFAGITTNRNTRDAYIGTIREYPDIRISMEGRDRVFDNVFAERFRSSLKHEGLYLKGYS